MQKGRKEALCCIKISNQWYSGTGSSFSQGK
jgi:hypothetical protein